MDTQPPQDCIHLASPESSVEESLFQLSGLTDFSDFSSMPQSPTSVCQSPQQSPLSPALSSLHSPLVTSSPPPTSTPVGIDMSGQPPTSSPTLPRSQVCNDFAVELINDGKIIPTLLPQDPTWHGFCVIGDNIDKNVNPRHQTLEHTARSLHYFNSYAVLDRINLSGLSDEQPSMELSSFDYSSLFPSPDDYKQLKAGFAVLVSRVLAQHFPCFEKIANITRNHITHEHYQEMSQKSKVVCI